MEYLKEETQAQKLLFTGLDNAGKTSIILTLQREFSKFAILSPTKGAQRRVFSFLGKHISEWDLGGQENYRISYLRNPDKYFEGTEIAIYVIDTINRDRHEEALSYLKDVIEKFEELEIEPPIFIFFHKYDPVIVKTSIEELNNTLIKIKQTIKEEIDYKKIYYYTTSIYDKPTIISAMSEILLTLYPKSELLQRTIEEYVKKVNGIGGIVVDENSLVICTYFSDDDSKAILNTTTPHFLALHDSLNLSIKGTTTLPNNDEMLIHRFEKYFVFKPIPLDDQDINYYLLLLKDSPEFTESYFETFSSVLKEVLAK
ncbi:MAG: ADP-ribosylation factor-like protein [Promethearchaeota archaeon]